LLATLAFELPDCPKAVLLRLVPPLLQLADVVEMSFVPDDFREHLPELAARPLLPKVQEYAFIILRLLGAAGPAGWLRSQWIEWNRMQPDMLERLTRHSQDFGSLLTPVTLSMRQDDPHWNTQKQIVNEWPKFHRRNKHSLHVQLLQASDVVRFPHAYLFWKILKLEEDKAYKGINWRDVWNAFLQSEMKRGHYATYQTCLNLRLLLAKDNEKQQEEIVSEVVSTLSLSDERQRPALIPIADLYLRPMRSLQALQELLRLPSDTIVEILCDLLVEQTNASSTLVLLSLYSVFPGCNSDLSQKPERRREIKEKVKQSLRVFQEQVAFLTAEQCQLIAAIKRLVFAPTLPLFIPLPSQTSEVDQASQADLSVLKQQQELTSSQVEVVLKAYADARHEVAWELLNQQFKLRDDAVTLLIDALSDTNPLICTAAALLLKNAEIRREEVAQAILKVLHDDTLSHRPTWLPSRYYGSDQLDDVLFDTLKKLAD
jgi:hypothetical protein